MVAVNVAARDELREREPSDMRAAGRPRTTAARASATTGAGVSAITGAGVWTTSDESSVSGRVISLGASSLRAVLRLIEGVLVRLAMMNGSHVTRAGTTF